MLVVWFIVEERKKVTHVECLLPIAYNEIIGRNRNIPGSHIRKLCNNGWSGQGTVTKMENSNAFE